MRHRKAGVKLNRTTSHRTAMFRNMVTSLFKYDRIRTTNAKAKELRRLADHIITLAKRGDLHARRQVLSIVREKAVVHKLFEQADQRFGASAGGYTRVIKLGRRPGDAAPISLIELVMSESKPKKKKTAKKTKKPEVAKKKVEAAKAPEVEKTAEPKKEGQKPQKAKAETKAKGKARKKAAEEPKKAKSEVKAKRATTKKTETDKQETQPDTKAAPAAQKPKAEAKKAEKTEIKTETKSKPAAQKKPSTDKK